ncbi:MAG: amidohydrolase [Clostridiales bacterium]|nr:amidohydrolase [Clostridiales bacterium]
MDSVSLQYLTDTRRKLHSLAELSGKEYKTSEFIVSELKRFGYKPKTIGTGVYCDAGKGNNRIAFRADIDALPITENVGSTGMHDYAAQSGVMHACGHDGHTANLLNVARIVGGKSKTPLRFIFQFGEEGEGGSQVMIDEGVLDGVSEIYALHLCPEIEQGKIGYCYGSMFAGCCEFDIDVTGKACHCATPSLGADAVRASVEIAEKAFNVAQNHGLLLNLGKVSGGLVRNVVADSCKSEYTLRFYDMAKCEAAMLDIERAALNADDAYGTNHTLISRGVYPPLINSALAVDKVRSVMKGRCIAVEPRYTAEDFSNYLLKITGCMVWLGVRAEGHTSPLHSECFSFDESALLTGTELFMKLIEASAEVNRRTNG